MQKLIDITDLKAREELGDYYIVSKSRIENLISCFEGGAKRIAELTKMVEEQQSEIARLSMHLVKEEPNNCFNNEDDMQNQHWCMCVKLKDVARDGKSTCSICGGRDAYGLSTERPEDKKKTITTTYPD